MHRYIVFLLGLREFKNKTVEEACMRLFSPFFSKEFNLILIHLEIRTEKEREREREKNVDKEGNGN